MPRSVKRPTSSSYSGRSGTALSMPKVGSRGDPCYRSQRTQGFRWWRHVASQEPAGSRAKSELCPKVRTLRGARAREGPTGQPESRSERRKFMTFTEAATLVLRLVGKPLHFKEITDVAIERNLLSHVG